MPLWEHIDNISDVIISMLKNILIITIINHLKINMNNLSYNFVKKLYNYKSGEEVSTKLNLQEAQKNIRLMIINNDWNSITSARITNSLKTIYINYDTQNISIKKKLEFKLIIFFSYWSLGNFISLFFISPIHAAIEIYRYKCIIHTDIEIYRHKRLIPNYNKIINTLLSLLITFIYNNSILTAFITAFGYPLLINNLTISFLNNLLKKKYILIDIHFINRLKLIYMIKYTFWIIINNYLCTDIIYKNYFYTYDYITFKNYINNTNSIGSLLIVNIINTSIHKVLFLTLYISNIMNNNNLINLIINFYLIFVLSNLYDVINKKINNINVINDSLIKKNYQDKTNNINKETNNINKETNNINKEINNDDNNQFKYFLEESMIIIN
jgi:hypothetical protein